jgi:Holliday junction DNA helicase RuvA
MGAGQRWIFQDNQAEVWMISLLRGTVAAIENDCIVVDVGGVGYQVFVPGPIRDNLQIDEAVFLHTRLVIREDNWILCGFETKESREYFNLLLGVNGVGPRLAIMILSILSPEIIRRGIFNEQADIFCRVPGIGKKTAQKILLYLQDRIPSTGTLEPMVTMTDMDGEVLAALTTLGYSIVEAQAALQHIPRDSPNDVETRLRLALQYFTR